MARRKRTLSGEFTPGAAARRRDEGGFTLIELLVVIIILGVLSAVVVFAVQSTGDKGKSAAIATDAKTVRTAEEAYCARFGSYGTKQELVDQQFLSEKSGYSEVVLGSGGTCGNSANANSAFTIADLTATIKVAANADQWKTSDSGSDYGYSSSAFVYPLNSNLNEPLLIMNPDYTIVGGLATGFPTLIPKGTNRSTIDGMTAGTPAALPSSPTAYTACSGQADRPFCNETWRFHLRQGVKFHDGQPFDADDVIWTWRDRQPISCSVSDGENTLAFTTAVDYGGLANCPGTVAANCTSNLTLCGYDSVEKIDKYTVDFTPRTQNLRFPEQVLHPKGAIVEVLRDAAGNPQLGPAFQQTPNLSSSRYAGRHLDGSTGGIPIGAAYFNQPSATVATPLVKNATSIPQGTGPFKFVSYSPTTPQGGGTASFVANTDYWGAPAKVAGMDYNFIGTLSTRTAGLQSGLYDMAIDLNPADVAVVQGTGKNVATAPYGQNSLIYVNKVPKTSPGTLDLSKVPPATPPNYTFNIGADPEVRRAASLAIDRTAYLTAIYSGNAAIGRWMAPPGILGTYQNLVTPMVTDLAAARTALDNDGWTCYNTTLGAQGIPGAGTACATSPSTTPPNQPVEIRKWNGATTKFSTGRPLDLYMIGISLIPQGGYDLMAAQMKLVGMNVVTERGSCDSGATCLDGSVSRSQMYNTSMWDFDVELPNQNDANAAFLPVLRMACKTATNFRFAPADAANATGPSVNDTVANGGGTFPLGNAPCATAASSSITTPTPRGPFDNTLVPASDGAATTDANQNAAAQMMAILVNQNQTNVVIPILGQFRIYGMAGKVSLPASSVHPSQTSQRWTNLSKSP